MKALRLIVLCLAFGGCEGPTGPAGPIGATGAAGPAGPVGVSGYQVITVAHEVASGRGVQTFDAKCPTGKRATGGGYRSSSSQPLLQVIANEPTSDGWAITLGSIGVAITLYVYAVCVNVS